MMEDKDYKALPSSKQLVLCIDSKIEFKNNAFKKILKNNFYYFIIDLYKTSMSFDDIKLISSTSNPKHTITINNLNTFDFGYLYKIVAADIKNLFISYAATSNFNCTFSSKNANLEEAKKILKQQKQYLLPIAICINSDSISQDYLKNFIEFGSILIIFYKYSKLLKESIIELGDTAKNHKNELFLITDISTINNLEFRDFQKQGIQIYIHN